MKDSGVGVGLVVGGCAGAAVAASADEVMPSAVEDFSYPGAARILEETGVQLLRGDGGIVLADCEGEAGAEDQIIVFREDRTDLLCFTVTGSAGFVEMSLPKVSGIGAGERAVTATVDVDGAVRVVRVDSFGTGPVGKGSAADEGSAVLLRLQVGA